MNLPNKLSMLRIILIPVTMFFMLPVSLFGWEPSGWNEFIARNGMLIAAIVFIIASITDFLDGQIARRYNMITNLGKFLDSLADKMLVIAVLIALVAIGRISPWLLAIIVLREFMVTGIRLLASKEGVVMAAQMIGKIKTVTQMIAIIYIMFEPTIFKLVKTPGAASVHDIPWIMTVGDILFGICVIMTIISGIDYLTHNLKYFKESD